MSALVGYCPACGRETLYQGMGGHITCGHLECPRPTAVDELLQDRETDHIVYLGEHTFTVRHPLRERIGDELLDCQLHSWIADLDGPPAVPGKYQALEREGGWAFIPV